MAAKQGNTNMVKELLSANASIFSTFHGRMPLHHASISGHISVVKLLLQWGANIESRDEVDFYHTLLIYIIII